MERLESLLLFLARSLVEEPDKVEVAASEEDSRVELELKVAPDDVGRVIGRQGRVVKSMRTVLRASAAKLGKRVSVEVKD
jgi:predicted RNA-binding protein YlqC (UPF0109 family)